LEKKSVGLLELETAVLECFLEKTPLSPLGVKHYHLTIYMVNIFEKHFAHYFDTTWQDPRIEFQK
jgi:hypothetical protein